MRTITVFSTLGKNAQEVASSASIWSELQKDLSHKNISYSGMKAVVGETRLTVESPNAVLPETDFSLYLMPIKTKSGADRKELFATIKTIVEKTPSAKSFFIVDGKNMTQLSTTTLEDLVSKYTGKPIPQAATPAVKEKPVKEEKVKEEPEVPSKTEVAAALAQKISDLIENADLDDDYQEEINAKVANIVALVTNTDVSKPNVAGIPPQPTEKAAPVESEQAKEARLAKEAKDKKNQEMAAKAASMMNDFNDVRR